MIASELVGIGLRSRHVAELIGAPRAAGWLEVHAENFMSPGPATHALARLRAEYPVSVHGVGLSLGSAGGLDRGHLRRLRRLVDALQPALVSEHVAWSGRPGLYLNALLPVPYTDESLANLAAHVRQAQDALGRQILVENPAAYVSFRSSTRSEPEFLAALCLETGCGLLLDINNVFVTCTNVGLDPIAYLDAIPPAIVREIHLAGHHSTEIDGRHFLIDDHGSRISSPVWALYRRALDAFGAVPTLIEWDANVPPLATLLDEAREAGRQLGSMAGA